MSRTAGWYPDESNNHINRYWDGTAWTSEKVWDGTAWVDHVAPPPTSPPIAAAAPAAAEAAPAAAQPAAAQPPATAPSAGAQASAAVAPVIDKIKASWDAGEVQVPKSPASWTLIGGAAVAALGGFMPWLHASGLGRTDDGSKPSGGGGIVVLLLALVLVGIVLWPAVTSTLSKARCIGVTVVAGLLTLIGFLSYQHLSDLKDAASGSGVSIGPGTGMYLFFIGLIAVIVGTVLSWRAAQAAASAPGA